MHRYEYILPLFIILTTKRRQFGKIKLFISKTPKGNSEEEKRQRKLEKNKTEKEESLNYGNDEGKGL
ncbi:hypothetical protein DSCO28_24040 [Desulfosarcina ovata subsp. sediminis]|uniref:Uncharacterized protein n=1 Tax=Desulfosarcina ovata subsp. sediminis TaxID=885957 RepID=A0A5K7ZI12_9BACT|nr:hypothetical protein DSCO28_24040 [Desulfosarcina ovata subsp. sediminis]